MVLVSMIKTHTSELALVQRKLWRVALSGGVAMEVGDGGSAPQNRPSHTRGWPERHTHTKLHRPDEGQQGRGGAA